MGRFICLCVIFLLNYCEKIEFRNENKKALQYKNYNNRNELHNIFN